MNKDKSSWQRVRSEPGPDLKLFRARFDHMKNPRNGKTERMIILEADDAANVIALTPDKHMLLVKQYRFGIEADTIELPGGIINAGETPETGARRELAEETGFTAHQWHYLGKVPSNPVFIDSYIHHLVAIDAEVTETRRLDEGEKIEVLQMPMEEVRKKLTKGFFQHPHTVNALLLFFNRYPDNI